MEIQNPRNGQVTAAFANGWQYLMDTLTPNFVNFAPFGLVMVIMIAIGVAEHSGLGAAKTAMRVFKGLHGHEPKIKAVHAGLEYGLFSEKLPGVNIISFGPTIDHAHSPEERLHHPLAGRLVVL